MRNPATAAGRLLSRRKLLGDCQRFYNGRREDDSGFRHAFAESDDDRDPAAWSNFRRVVY
jgi:hypothetical protein